MTQNLGTEPVIAPATVAPQPMSAAPQPYVVLPLHKTVERQGSRGEPYSHRHPTVRGGTCEWCGVMDKNYPAEHQYKLCAHYRGMQLRCSYCPEAKNPDEIAYRSVLNVADHPEKPNTLVVWCDSYECSKKHIERFKLSK